MNPADCELCAAAGETVLWRDARARVIAVAAPANPGTCRVVLAAHVAEMTDLPRAERAALLEIVLAVEEAVRVVVHPDKVNLASLGNIVPHLHWHVIPRWRDDPWFPGATFGEPRRRAVPRAAPDDLARRLADEIGRRLG